MQIERSPRDLNIGRENTCLDCFAACRNASSNEAPGHEADKIPTKPHLILDSSRMSEPTHAPNTIEPLGTSTAVDAEKPFDASATKADLVLRSSDSIDFFVMKSILSLASPILNDALLPNQGEGDLDKKNGLPMVRLEEDSATLYNLLQLIYPYGMEPNNIEVCVKVGQAAEKYTMNGVIQRLRKIIPTCEALTKEPLRAFAIAVHFDWPEMIKDAAWNTLTIPLCDLNRCDELRMLSGADYHDLLQWRFACEKALHELLTGWQKGYPSGPTGAPAMAERIQEKLKETGCPRSATLMDESVPSRAFERAKSNISYQEILESAKVVATQIDEKVSKVRIL